MSDQLFVFTPSKALSQVSHTVLAKILVMYPTMCQLLSSCQQGSTCGVVRGVIHAASHDWKSNFFEQHCSVAIVEMADNLSLKAG